MNKELSIIAQNAGTTAANLLSTYYNDASPDSGLDSFIETFEEVRRNVFEGILKLAGESAVTVDDVVREFPGATAVAGTEASAPTGNAGSYKFTTGKYAGKTISEVDSIPVGGANRDGGRGYLEYYAENGKQDNVVRAVKAYLAAAA